MSIELIYLEDVFEELNLELPNLNICNGSNSFFSMLRPQFKESLMYDNIVGPYIENKKFDTLCLETIITAKKESVDVLLTPEYSFSYDVIEKIITDESGELKPNIGKLWCLCCQGISVDSFTSKMLQFKNDAIVIENAIKSMDELSFVNALIYIFVDGSGKIILVPQIKTHTMGDAELLCEGKGLSLGNVIYKIGKGKSNQICSIVCADVFQYNRGEINIQDLKRVDESMILLHPQLNGKPRHETFAAFRRNAYDLEHYENLVYITANWASGTKLVNNDPSLGIKDLEIMNPWTSIYMKDKNKHWLETERDRRNHNESKGLGFGYYRSKKVKVWFNYKYELMHLLTIKKPRNEVPVVTVSKIELLVDKCYVRQSTEWCSKDTFPMKDNLCDVININKENDSYCYPIKASKALRDIFFGLSLGGYEEGQLQIEDNEIHQNIGTHIDDECEKFRESNAIKFKKLVYYLQNQNLPENMNELIKNHKFAIVENTFNLVSKDPANKNRAIVAFVENKNEARRLSERYEKKIKKLYYPTPSGVSLEDIERLKKDFELYSLNKVCVISNDEMGVEVVFYPVINENITNPDRKQNETSIVR